MIDYPGSDFLPTASVQDAVMNQCCNRLATIAAEGSVCIFDRGAGQELWKLAAEWTVHSRKLCRVAWSDSIWDVVAIANTLGQITLWKERVQAGRREWRLQASCWPTHRPIHDLKFAPAAFGLLLAAASASGHIRVYRAVPTASGLAVQLDNEFLACHSGPATCLSWRPSTKGVPPLIVVGTTDGAQVWTLNEGLGCWTRARVIQQGAPIRSVHWAATIGRPKELVAVASGACAAVFSLTGETHDLQVEQVARLDHAAPVVKVEWNALGTWLAASTKDCQVQQWRANLVGDWRLQGKVVGRHEGMDVSNLGNSEAMMVA